MPIGTLDSGGGGSTDDGDLSTSDDGGSDTTSFDTSTQDLSTTTFGTSTGDEDSTDTGDIEVTRSSDDPNDSSPAGGTGSADATERAYDLDDDALSDASYTEVVERANAELDAEQGNPLPLIRERVTSIDWGNVALGVTAVGAVGGAIGLLRGE